MIQGQEDKETATPGENDLRWKQDATGHEGGLFHGEERVESSAAGEYESIAKVIRLKEMGNGGREARSRK